MFVLNSLRHLPTGKAVGLDGLSGYFLKLSAPSIASSLTTIFNLRLSLGSFPGLWKKAKVSPIFKDGSLFDRSNYRPISVLAILSKILERHVHISFYNFLLKMTCSPNPSLASESLALASLLLLILSIVFSTIWTPES